jgi:hypothetical protein
MISRSSFFESGGGGASARPTGGRAAEGLTPFGANDDVEVDVDAEFV